MHKNRSQINILYEKERKKERKKEREDKRREEKGHVILVLSIVMRHLARNLITLFP